MRRMMGILVVTAALSSLVLAANPVLLSARVKSC